jgi:hypothetical protein
MASSSERDTESVTGEEGVGFSFRAGGAHPGSEVATGIS